MGPTWGPPGSCRPQMDPKLAPWTLLLGHINKSKLHRNVLPRLQCRPASENACPCLGQNHKVKRSNIGKNYPDSYVHGANMEPTWVLLAPDGPHVAPMNIAIRVMRLMIRNNQLHPFSIIYVPQIKWFWKNRSGSKLVRLMVCGLTAPNHYLNQCWFIINEGIHMSIISQEVLTGNMYSEI